MRTPMSKTELKNNTRKVNKMSNELAESNSVQLTPLQKVALLKERKSIIQKVMSDLMQKGEHFDVIPGTKKETLLKSGAELLTSVFNLAPKFQIQTKDFDNGHREYTIICELYSVDNCKFLGSGVGLCSSLESKYRYKGNSIEETQMQLPENYWDRKKAGEKNLLPPGHKTEKIDGNWRIVKVLEKKENTDIADTYNTILKMGKKRALVDATLTVTGASDIFTQDVEDMDLGQKSDPKKEAPNTELKRDNPKPANDYQRIAEQESLRNDDIEGRGMPETEQEYLARMAREENQIDVTDLIGKAPTKEDSDLYWKDKTGHKEFFEKYPTLELFRLDTGKYVFQPRGTYAATKKAS